MRRREFVAAAGAALLAPLARAQKRLPVVGVLTPHPAPPLGNVDPVRDARRARLKQFGWVEGETLRFERPAGGGREDRLPALAAELVQKRVDAIWAIGPEAAVAAARATQSIPVIFWGAPYPVEQGLVDSYARPGRNVTGVAFQAAEAEGAKLFEILTEIAPAARRVATISTPTALGTVAGGTYTGAFPAYERALQRLGIERKVFVVRAVEEMDEALAAVAQFKPSALHVPGTTLTFRERRRFAAFAAGNRIPSAFSQPEFVEAGGLFSYGIERLETELQLVAILDKVLRGTRPADIPVELPRKYELVINQKTAATLGLKVPQMVLLRADRVIE